MKLRWTFKDAVLYSQYSIFPYRVFKHNKLYVAYAGLDLIEASETQLEAIKACQDYEDKLYYKKD